VYAVAPAGLDAAHAWLAHLADPLAPFAQPLDALATEVARGRRPREVARRHLKRSPERPERMTS
jgi:hypothetical protein